MHSLTLAPTRRSVGLRSLHTHRRAGHRRLNLLPIELRPDYNRDGVIDDKDAGKVTTDNPWRWWIDDDHSDRVSTIDPTPERPNGQADYGGTLGPETYGALDWFPVYLDIKQLLEVLPPGNSVQYVLHQNEGALNFLNTSMTPDDTSDFLLAGATSGYGDNLDKALKDADKHQITNSGYTLSNTFLNKIKDEGKGVLLLQGRAATEKPLLLVVYKDGQEVAKVRMPLKIDGVEKMYRWINLRGIQGVGGSVGLATNIGEPANYPDKLTNDKHFVFVHGYNDNEYEARGWCAQMFKRLYQSGSKAKFTGVAWRGEETQLNLDPLPEFTYNFWINVSNAFRTSQPLASAVNALPGTKVIAAHSLGNMVVSSAITDFGENSLHVANYFMLDAAVALEAYSGSNALSRDAMRNPAWQGYDNRLWASDPSKVTTSTTDGVIICTPPTTGQYRLWKKNGNVARTVSENKHTSDYILPAKWDDNGNVTDDSLYSWNDIFPGGYPSSGGKVVLFLEAVPNVSSSANCTITVTGINLGCYCKINDDSDGGDNSQSSSMQTMRKTGVVRTAAANTSSSGNNPFLLGNVSTSGTPLPVQLTAYRPQMVPNSIDLSSTNATQMIIPQAEVTGTGVHIRVNGDNENTNLVKVTFSCPSLTSMTNYTAAVQTSGSGLVVWSSSNKGTCISGNNNQGNLTLDGSGNATLWIEATSSGSNNLTFLLKSGNTTSGTMGSLPFVNYDSFVQAYSGETFNNGDAAARAQGIFNVAQNLYLRGYNIAFYNVHNINDVNGTPAFTELSNQIQNGSVKRVGIFGYSHGGGQTFNTSNLLTASGLVNYQIVFTGYVDAIQHTGGNNGTRNMNAEMRYPPGSAYHWNYFQTSGNLHSNATPGAAVNLNVNTTPWGSNLVHFTHMGYTGLMDSPNVQNDLTSAIESHVPKY